MTAPHVEEESTSISLVVENWACNQVEQFSPIHRIGGYPWRLCLNRWGRVTRHLYVICDKSNEAVLWHCTATFTSSDLNIHPDSHMFTSWDKYSHKRYLGWIPHVNGQMLKINFAIKNEGNSWRLRPTLGPYDKIFVVGEDKQKIPVNKESLASQSSFFDRLFNGDFKEKNMEEIFIGDVDYEEFCNLIEMVYGSDEPSLTKENVHRALQLVDRFDLKIAEDRVVNFLLSSASSVFSIHKKLLISDQFNLPFLKDKLLKSYTEREVIGLSKSAEFDQLSHDSLQDLLTIDSFPVSPSSHVCWEVPLLKSRYVDNSNTISMVVEDCEGVEKEEQFSSVHRINGFPWRLRIEREIDWRGSYCYTVSVICDKSKEAELWKCTARISCNVPVYGSLPLKFTSWDKNSHEPFFILDEEISVGSVLIVSIATDVNGDTFCRRPSLDPLEPRDGVLVFEDTEKKIEVNKKSLASQSPYFDSLFFGNSKEKDMSEFPVGDVDFEEFAKIMDLLYRDDDNNTVNCGNAERMLQLADRFEIKIVRDRVVSFLLSSSSSNFSLPKKLLISDQYDLPFLKNVLLDWFTCPYQLRHLRKSPECNQLSKETLRILFKKFCR